MTVTARELTRAALEFQSLPKAPYSVGFTADMQERFTADARGADLFARMDNVLVGHSPLKMDADMTDEQTKIFTDEFGVTWDRSIDSDIGVPAPVLDPDTVDDYTFPDPHAAWRYEPIAAALQARPDHYHVMTIGFSLFERAWSLRGMENLLMDFAERPEFVETLLDRICDFNVAVVETGLKRCPDLDAVYFGDDFGSQLGLMMGPRIWREMLKPRLARQYAAVAARGKKVFIHSCGHVQEIFDDLVEIGVNVFNPFQPEVMDVHALLDQYHGRLAFHGGISTQRLLPFGTVDEVRQEVAALIEKAKRGGYIVAPAHAMPRDCKVENVIAMLEMLIDQP